MGVQPWVYKNITLCAPDSAMLICPPLSGYHGGIRPRGRVVAAADPLVYITVSYGRVVPKLCDPDTDECGVLGIHQCSPAGQTPGTRRAIRDAPPCRREARRPFSEPNQPHIAPRYVRTW